MTATAGRAARQLGDLSLLLDTICAVTFDLENFLQRVAPYHRRCRRFGVTLVVWNEDAWEKCFHLGPAVA